MTLKKGCTYLIKFAYGDIHMYDKVMYIREVYHSKYSTSYLALSEDRKSMEYIWQEPWHALCKRIVSADLIREGQ